MNSGKHHKWEIHDGGASRPTKRGWFSLMRRPRRSGLILRVRLRPFWPAVRWTVDRAQEGTGAPGERLADGWADSVEAGKKAADEAMAALQAAEE